ncbi:MAG: sugar phosphate nucleotidyltransferase, partial [Pseudomonadota bacterium]
MAIAVTPVVLSGGSGTRLWPRSRSMYPKQLLALAGEETMLQSTVLRLRGLPVEVRQPIVVCNASHRFLVAEQLRQIGAEPRIILEPEGRNTAPAAFLAAHAEAGHGGERSALLVLPADHVIQDKAALHESIALAVELIVDRAETLVTFGIVPASP